MERKQIAGVALIGLILAAILGFATFKTMQSRQVPPSVAEADQAGEDEAPPKVRRHGPKVKKKVDLASTFSDFGASNQSWGDQPEEQPQEPQKEFHKQTPEEAVETVWQGLDTYREMSPEDQARTRMMMTFMTSMINMMGNTADNWMGNMTPEQRDEAIENAANMLNNIEAIELEIGPDMTDEERAMLEPTLDSIRNLGAIMLDRG